MRKQSTFIALGLGVLATVVGSSCRREASRTEPARTTTSEGSTTVAPPAREAAERDMALVRVVNAIAPGPADVYADDLKAFPGIEYKAVTPYQELLDNEVTFRLNLGGKAAGEAIVKENEMLMDGRHYTVVAMPGEGKTAELKVLADELTPPETGKAKVRVVNASRDVAEVEMTMPGGKEPLMTGIGINDNSGYKEIDPTAGKIILRDETKKRVVAEVPATLEAGKLYTVFLLGRAKAAGKADALMVQDELASPTGAPKSMSEAAAPPKY